MSGVERVLAIVPARGGSKGIPRKNLQAVGGRTLVERTIDVLQACPVIGEILVSTDDSEIAEIARATGASVPFLRPPELATDEATTSDVVRHALLARASAGHPMPARFVLAEPTNPFRRSATIVAAIERAHRGDVGSVIAVCPLERKPQYIFRKADGLVERYIRDPAESFSRRQDMRHLCRLSNIVWVVDTNAFLANGRLLQAPVGYVEAGELESLNIDEPVDLEFARFLVQSGREAPG